MVGVIAAAPLPGFSQTKGISERADACIVEASAYHSVNPDVLRAIVLHESRGRASTISRNKNGSVDSGLTGINSVHWDELRKKGVTPENLLDECVSVYVGAWKLSKKVFKYGNTWDAVGAYNSETPYYKNRYSILIYNQMIDMGTLNEPKLAVPPLIRK